MRPTRSKVAAGAAARKHAPLGLFGGMSGTQALDGSRSAFSPRSAPVRLLKVVRTPGGRSRQSDRPPAVPGHAYRSGVRAAGRSHWQAAVPGPGPHRRRGLHPGCLETPRGGARHVPVPTRASRSTAKGGETRESRLLPSDDRRCFGGAWLHARAAPLGRGTGAPGRDGPRPAMTLAVTVR
jgi:hypothetical protein